MYVVKRNGEREPVHFDKITRRIASLCEMEPKLTARTLDPTEIAMHVIQGLKSGMATSQLDALASETLAYKTIDHPDFGTLAARLEISNLHKETCGDFVLVTHLLRDAGLLGDGYCEFAAALGRSVAEMIDYSRDFNFDYFGIKTLMRAYLLNIGPNIVERPQDMWMRVAIQLNMGSGTGGTEHGATTLARIRETYDLLSQGYYTHATPTLYSAGTRNPQMSSCFLLTMKEDSISGIFDTLRQCALISKHAGGIGLDISKVRSTASYIRGTNGKSNGIVPMLRIFNNTARYVDQGGGKRKGSFAMYIEPWHADVEEFLELKKNHGKEESRARDLFYALWVPDLFMKRVESGGSWSLFCPDECPGLCDTFGEEFEGLYTRYESEGKARKVVQAMVLWQKVLTSQVETGTPYVLYKDHINRKSMQANVGIIRSSNLCAEIVEHTNPDEVAVCNLASINLSKFVGGEAAVCKCDASPAFDLERLREVVRVCVRNLNNVIDMNHYPVPEARSSNLRNRPVGLGVQGLADVFAQLMLPFDSPEARLLNRRIFEHMYFAALTESCALAAESGKPYQTFEGSPASRGLLQFDLWAQAGHFETGDMDPELVRPWKDLKGRIAASGLKNSLLIALMPTASTSQILGNNECFEPFTNNLYSRRTLAGEFMVANKHLQRFLISRNLWDRKVVEMLMASNGSVQGEEFRPIIDEHSARVFRTVWEIPQRSIVDMALERGPFVDQTQSMNIFIAQPTASKLNSMHFYGWRKGIKTGSYYIRTQSSARAIQFTVSKEATEAAAEGEEEEEGICESCQA
jgi:ribonucleoside-diphosphate reductase alpha subunit